MAKLLLVTNGLPGLLFSSLELARRLEAGGHTVVYASDAGAREVVERHGVEFVPLPPDGYRDFLQEDARDGIFGRLRNLEARRERGQASRGLADFRQMLARVSPELVLVDAEMHEHVIEVVAAGMPLALLNTFVSIWRRPGLPPPHRMTRPGVGWKGSHAGIALQWTQLRLRKAWRRSSLALRQVGCDRVSLLRRQMEGHGLEPRRLVDSSQWPIPFTFRDLPFLSLHALEFEFPHRPPARVTYVGPMIPEARPDTRVEAEDRSLLDAVLERCRSDEARKLIYAGFGSFFTARSDLVRRLISAVATRPDWELVLSLGGGQPADTFERVPPNVTVVAWAPQLELLAVADAAVTHGGINTADECVTCGVPMLVYCGRETDMAGATSRVVHHRLGLAGDERRDDERTITSHLERLLHEPELRESTDRMRERYLAYAREGVAERAVETLLEST